MAFFSRAGKTSGVCKGCNRIKNTEGECGCAHGDGHATCMGCGAEGFVPDKNADEKTIRAKIGCNCGSGS